MSFWSLELRPGKVYKQNVEESFRLSTAALAHKLDNPASDCRSSVAVSVNGEPAAIVCTLVPLKVEQQVLDLIFMEGDEVEFSVVGENTIFLSGNIADDGLFDEDGLDGEMESDLESDGASVSDGSEDLSEEEEEEEAVEVQSNKRPVTPPPEQPAKKQKSENVEVKKPQKKEESRPAEVKADQPTTAIKKLPSGLVMEDLKKGDGARAKNGSRVLMRYVGKLASNGKLFDQNTQGKPFSFVLGKGEVIKGWDIGIQGMQVGGMRRLTIPAALAYGKRGAAPDIPPNATLTFDVKLLEVKK